MGTQNLNNYYFNRLDTKLNYSSYYDIFLASDERDFNQQVVYSNAIINATSGDSLPVWIDLNDLACSEQPLENCTSQTGASLANTLVVVSKNYWPKAKYQCECPYSGSSFNFTVCDASWTGMDNGSLPPPTPFAPYCYYLRKNYINTAQRFSTNLISKELKLRQVRPLTNGGAPNTTIDTSIVSATDSSGYYEELRGGFYQGFYKLYGYPYEVLPTRPNRGWSFETYLKINTVGSTIYGPDDTPPYDGSQGVYGNCYNSSGYNRFINFLSGVAVSVTFSAATICRPPTETPSGANIPQALLNYSPPSLPSNNGGFFFYKGVRAEDKWGFSGSNIDTYYENLSACTSISGITGCCNTEEETVKLLYQNQSENAQYDVYNNALGFRLTDDMRIGYRTLRYTGECITTGGTQLDMVNDCDTGKTFFCDYEIEESYSDPICAFITKSGNCQDTWVQIDVVFRRNLELEDCDIFNYGGINDLVKVRTDKFQRYGRHEGGTAGPFGCNPQTSPSQTKPCCDEYPPFIGDAYFDFRCDGPQMKKWFDDRVYRLGTLTFYVNGRIVHEVENFEEIIPRQLNTNKQTQVGVAYNMSWGGGALGLSSALIPSVGCDQSWVGFNPNADQTLIRNNFGGTFVGGISQMMYYVEPLTPDEIYHNFTINRERYDLVDCEECKNCNNGCIDCDLPSDGEGTFIPESTGTTQATTGGTLVVLVTCEEVDGNENPSELLGLGTYQCVDFNASVGDTFLGNPFPLSVLGGNVSAWNGYNRTWMVAITGGPCVVDYINPTLNTGGVWQNLYSYTYSIQATQINQLECSRCCNEIPNGWQENTFGGLWGGLVPNPETGACWAACP